MLVHTFFQNESPMGHSSTRHVWQHTLPRGAVCAAKAPTRRARQSFIHTLLVLLHNSGI